MEQTNIKQQNISGNPVNTKSLLAFLFCQMGKLERHEISNEEACAQAKLASQASNLLNYELKRSLIQIQLRQVGENVKPALREIESKPFDSEILPLGQNETAELMPSTEYAQ